MKKEPLTEEKNTFTSQIYTSQNKLYLKTHSNLNYKQEIILATQDKKIIPTLKKHLLNVRFCSEY